MDEQAALDARLTPTPDARRLWTATLREAFETGAPVVLVAEVDSRIAGFVVLEDAATAPVYVAEPAVHIGELYVAPAHRRAGVARALLDAAADEAVRAGARTLRFDVAASNAASHALVAAWGARPFATTYTRDL